MLNEILALCDESMGGLCKQSLRLRSDQRGACLQREYTGLCAREARAFRDVQESRRNSSKYKEAFCKLAEDLDYAIDTKLANVEIERLQRAKATACAAWQKSIEETSTLDTIWRGILGPKARARDRLFAVVSDVLSSKKETKD